MPAGPERCVDLGRDVADHADAPTRWQSRAHRTCEGPVICRSSTVSGNSRRSANEVDLGTRQEPLAVEQIAQPEPGAGRLVSIGETDSAAGGADRVRDRSRRRGLDGTVVGQDQMCRRAQPEPPGDLEPERARGASTSSRKVTTSTTTPLPIRQRFPGCRIPEGTRWSTTVSPFRITLWPALGPP